MSHWSAPPFIWKPKIGEFSIFKRNLEFKFCWWYPVTHTLAMDKRACSILAIILSISVAWVGGEAQVTVVPPPPPALPVPPTPLRLEGRGLCRLISWLCVKWLCCSVAVDISDEIAVCCRWVWADADDDDDVGSRPGRDFSADDNSSCSSSQRTVSRAAYVVEWKGVG